MTTLSRGAMRGARVGGALGGVVTIALLLVAWRGGETALEGAVYLCFLLAFPSGLLLSVILDGGYWQAVLFLCLAPVLNSALVGAAVCVGLEWDRRSDERPAA